MFCSPVNRNLNRLPSNTVLCTPYSKCGSSRARSATRSLDTSPRTSSVNVIAISGGPFRATQIFQEVVGYVTQNIVRKRRRHRMRYHENCFTGEHATNVVLTFLLQDRENFKMNISREQAVKLCQMLIEQNVLKCLTSRLTECTRTRSRFEDSRNKLYQFSDEISATLPTPSSDATSETDVDDISDRASTLTDCGSTIAACGSTIADCGSSHLDVGSNNDDEEGMSVDECESDTESGDASPHAEERGMCPDMEPDFPEILNPVTLDPNSPIIETARILRGSVRHKGIAAIAAIRNSFNDKKLVRHYSFREKDVPMTDVHPDANDEIWKEVALSKLLTLVDLPILDGLLSDDKSSKKNGLRYVSAKAISGLKRCASSDSLTSRYTYDDIWVQTALDVLEHLPIPNLKLDKFCTLRPSTALRREMFTIIAQHYNTSHDVILPEKFTDLHLRILKLIMQENQEHAVLSLQLHMLLTPQERTKELNHLLMFMVAVSNFVSCRLHPTDSNNSMVLAAFTEKIIKNSLLSSDLKKLFVGFLMDNVDKIFTIPVDLHEKVKMYVTQLSQGKSIVIDPESGCCSRLTEREYVQQMRENTEHALRELMMDALNDTTLSQRDKGKKVLAFKNAHLDVYTKYFSHYNVCQL